MTRGDYIQGIVDAAKDYRPDAKMSIKRNHHMNDVADGEIIEQRHIDAVLVDFINTLAMRQGMDLGLYTSDLSK